MKKLILLISIVSLMESKEIKIDISNYNDINISKSNQIDITPPPTKEGDNIAQPPPNTKSNIGIPDGNCPYGDDDCNIEYIRSVVGRKK